jgi:hypothetical protein
MNYLTKMHDAIARRQGWQFDRFMTDADPDKLARYRANEIRADDDARLMALASIAESLARIADALINRVAFDVIVPTVAPKAVT